MKSYFKIFEKVKNQAGATAIIVAITLPMLIGFGALAVDVGYMYVNRNELQNVADAAALAATRTLGTIYQAMTYEEQQVYVCGTDNDDITVIKGVANTVAFNNKAGGMHMIVFGMTEGGRNIDNVEIGVWDPDNIPPLSEDFTNYNQPDAVRVKVSSRDNATSRSISTWFANIFGIDAVNVSAYATAALTSQSSVGPGELLLPIGMSSLSLDECQDPIIFSPTNLACAGWTGFDFEPVNDPLLQSIITGGTESPPLGAGDEVNFIGGDLSSGTFYELLLLFKDMGHDVYVDGVDADGNEILLPVATYDEDGTPVPGHWDASRIEELNLEGISFTVHGSTEPLWLTDVDGNLIDDKGNLIPDDSEEKVRLWYPVPPPPDSYADDIERNRHLWETTILVYDEGPPDAEIDCDNPNQTMIISTFATIYLTDVIGPPHKTVIGNLMCETVSENDNRGGGGVYGTKGSIPNLVE
jgi:hypothetical protein